MRFYKTVGPSGRSVVGSVRHGVASVFTLKIDGLRLASLLIHSTLFFYIRTKINWVNCVGNVLKEEEEGAEEEYDWRRRRKSRSKRRGERSTPSRLRETERER